MKKLLLTILALAATVTGATAEDAVTLKLTGNDQMQYDVKELTVTAGQKVTIEFKHIGKLPKAAMGHNVVILKAGTEVPAFAMKCVAAKDNDYIAQDAESKKLIIAHSKMIGGGESTSFTFTAPAAGEYSYLCTFPGHFVVMQGKLIVKAK